MYLKILFWGVFLLSLTETVDSFAKGKLKQ